MGLMLSRLTLDGWHGDVRNALRDCHAMHRLVMAGFGADCGNRAAQGVLYRVELDQGLAAPRVIVQSAAEPVWDRLNQRGLVEERTFSLEPLLERLDRGSVWRFRLRANPTRKVDTKSGPDGRRRNGRRVAHATLEAQLAWLARKAEVHGFALVEANLTDEPPPPLGREGAAVPAGRGLQPVTEGAPRPLVFAGVLFEGRLRVLDPDRFRETLASGIGSGKAYGFGLLSIAPAPAASG